MRLGRGRHILGFDLLHSLHDISEVWGPQIPIILTSVFHTDEPEPNILSPPRVKDVVGKGRDEPPAMIVRQLLVSNKCRRRDREGRGRMF